VVDARLVVEARRHEPCSLSVRGANARKALGLEIPLGVSLPRRTPSRAREKPRMLAAAGLPGTQTSASRPEPRHPSPDPKVLPVDHQRHSPWPSPTMLVAIQ
jgi:hypothetical protein